MTLRAKAAADIGRGSAGVGDGVTARLKWAEIAGWRERGGWNARGMSPDEGATASGKAQRFPAVIGHCGPASR